MFLEAMFLLNQNLETYNTKFTNSLSNKIIKIKVSTTWNSDSKYYNKNDFSTLSPYMNDKYLLLNVINNYANTSNQVYGMSFCIVKGYRVTSDYGSLYEVSATTHIEP